jgi:hypothetical protein
VTQPPVRFENYPPEDGASPDRFGGEHTPVIRPYVPDQPAPPPSSGGSSRRTLIGLVIGIPVVGIIFSAMAAGSTFRIEDGTGDGYPDGSGDPGYPYGPDGSGSGDEGDPASEDQEFSVGGYTATAPAGWNVHDDGSGTVEVTQGANRLTAISLDTATSTLAVEEIARLAKRTSVGFSGKIGDPVDRSSADLQHATMDGSGKFNGKGARLMVELWIDDEGSGLLVSRVITAKVASAIAVQAQEMLNELSGEF